MSNKNIKKPKTKNDIAWEALFEKYSILEKIHEIGYFEIESNSINEFRESRLMAKFDHYDTLPTIFEQNKRNRKKSKYSLMQPGIDDPERCSSFDFNLGMLLLLGK